MDVPDDFDLQEFFEKHSDEFLKFERVENKLSFRPDVHAFLLLSRLAPGTFDIVSAAEHDEIFLEPSPDEVVKIATEQELIDLHRCGVRCDDGLCMFV